jgi:hypothetical protein
MKKALPGQKEVFIYESQGKVHVWDFFAEEIVEAANKGLKNEPVDTGGESIVCRGIYEWMSRYLKEGATEDFLNDLNNALHNIRYSKYLLPSDLLPSENGYPQNAYIAKYDKTPEPEAIAADDFSKLLSSGMLKRLKRCQMEGCAKFFLGPPQARWCSKVCGSKFRVRKKRKLDSL